ncbi:MAG: hypothetical protein JJE04_06900, partial [Acidobacteriia bacterium]|nr:hypothetical protein [Terriglobia bacterium]
VTLSLGYDHQYVYSPASEYDSQNQNTDMLLGRAGLQLNPALIAGLETTGSWTRYENPTLNNNMGYSFGAYADWMPGSYVHIQPRAGWTGMHFEQTSDSIKTSDINSWYANLTIIHAPTEAINYSFSVGHELRGGIESDAIEDTYARLAATWNAMKFLSMTTSLSYEHGKAGVGNDTGNLKETYDWFSGALGFSCPITERATLGLNYRLTLRSSDVSDNGYTQNMVSLHFNYAL